MGKSDGPNKTMKVVLYVLIVVVTAFFVVTLFKKQMVGDKNPDNQAPKETGITKEEEQKLINEKVELMKKGFSDALDGKIVSLGADKKTIKVQPDESEQLDENKTIDVIINNKTEIIKASAEVVPNKTGGDRNDGPSVKEKTETVEPDALQAGMVIQAQTAEMLEFKKENSITAVRIVIAEQNQPQE